MLLTRAPTESNAGKEEPPGGKIDPSETALEGAKREVFEETGIVLAHDPEFIMWGDLLTSDNKIMSRHFVFHARLTHKLSITINPEEHSYYKWIHISEVHDTLVHPRLIDVIKEYHAKFV